eukprot:1002109-Pyramimonas_sp.AAC.1
MQQPARFSWDGAPYACVDRITCVSVEVCEDLYVGVDARDKVKLDRRTCATICGRSSRIP